MVRNFWPSSCLIFLYTFWKLLRSVTWAYAHRGKWGQLTPWKMDEKLKSENIEKKQFSMFMLYFESYQGRQLQRTALCWPHIYSDILQNAPFRSQIFKIFFASGGKGALTPNQNPADVPAQSSELDPPPFSTCPGSVPAKIEQTRFSRYHTGNDESCISGRSRCRKWTDLLLTRSAGGGVRDSRLGGTSSRNENGLSEYARCIAVVRPEARAKPGPDLKKYLTI